MAAPDIYFKDELKIEVNPSGNSAVIKPSDSSYHYALDSSVSVIFEKEYVDLANEPAAGTRVMISYETAAPTIQDMAVGLANAGFSPNQLEIPAVGSSDNIKMNDYVYKAKITTKPGAVSWRNSFVVNFIKDGVTLSDIIKQKDLGVIKTSENTNAVDASLEQIVEKIKQFNPLADEDILSTVSFNGSATTTGITKTVKIQTSETWMSNKEVTVSYLAAKNDSLYVKFNTNDSITVNDGTKTYTVPNVLGTDGWRDISDGISIYVTGPRRILIYNKANKELTSEYADTNDNRNHMILGFAGYTANVENATVMRSTSTNNDKTLDLRYLYAPNLKMLNTHSSAFGKYLFADPTNYSPYLFSSKLLAGTNTSNDNWLYYNKASSDANNFLGFAPNWNANICTDITFYSYGWKENGAEIPLKFKQIWFSDNGDQSAYKWGASVNIHLPFGSTISVVQTPQDSTLVNRNNGNVLWKYVYDV